MTQPTCSVDSCDSPTFARQWCCKHYQRWLKHGDPLHVTRMAPVHAGATPQERLRHHGWTPVERVPALGPCWEWNGNRHINGDYGRLGVNGRIVGAHVLAYTTWVGPIPDGHLVRHRCDNPPCINPDHLLTGTALDNINDKVQRGRSGYRLPNAKRPEVVEAWKAGASCGELAQRYGVGILLIQRLVKPAREEMRRDGGPVGGRSTPV